MIWYSLQLYFSSDSPDGTGDHENEFFDPNRFDNFPEPNCQINRYNARTVDTGKLWFQTGFEIRLSLSQNGSNCTTTSIPESVLIESVGLTNGSIPIEYG